MIMTRAVAVQRPTACRLPTARGWQRHRVSRGSIAAGQGLGEEGGVVGEVLVLVYREIGFVIDRIHPAGRLAGTAIHAFVGVDVHGPSSLVDAIHRALLHTRLVHDIHTCPADHICHARKRIYFPMLKARAEGPFPQGPTALAIHREIPSVDVKGEDGWYGADNAGAPSDPRRGDAGLPRALITQQSALALGRRARAASPVRGS